MPQDDFIKLVRENYCEEDVVKATDISDGNVARLWRTTFALSVGCFQLTRHGSGRTQ